MSATRFADCLHLHVQLGVQGYCDTLSEDSLGGGFLLLLTVISKVIFLTIA